MGGEGTIALELSRLKELVLYSAQAQRSSLVVKGLKCPALTRIVARSRDAVKTYTELPHITSSGLRDLAENSPLLESLDIPIHDSYQGQPGLPDLGIENWLESLSSHNGLASLRIQGGRISEAPRWEGVSLIPPKLRILEARNFPLLDSTGEATLSEALKSAGKLQWLQLVPGKEFNQHKLTYNGTPRKGEGGRPAPISVPLRSSVLAEVELMVTSPAESPDPLAGAAMAMNIQKKGTINGGDGEEGSMMAISPPILPGLEGIGGVVDAVTAVEIEESALTSIIKEKENAMAEDEPVEDEAAEATGLSHACLASSAICQRIATSCQALLYLSLGEQGLVEGASTGMGGVSPQDVRLIVDGCKYIEYFGCKFRGPGDFSEVQTCLSESRS